MGRSLSFQRMERCLLLGVEDERAGRGGTEPSPPREGPVLFLSYRFWQLPLNFPRGILTPWKEVIEVGLVSKLEKCYLIWVANYGFILIFFAQHNILYFIIFIFSVKLSALF